MIWSKHPNREVASGDFRELTEHVGRLLSSLINVVCALCSIPPASKAVRGGKWLLLMVEGYDGYQGNLTNRNVKLAWVFLFSLNVYVKILILR